MTLIPCPISRLSNDWQPPTPLACHITPAYVQGDGDFDGERKPVAIAAMVATHPAAPASGDAPLPIPLGRWDVEDYPNKASSRQQSRFGSFVHRAEYFDAAAFNISR